MTSLNDEDLWIEILDLADANPSVDTDVLARKIARQLGAAKLKELAIAEIKRLMDSHRRSQVRKIEQAAEKQTKRNDGPPSKAHRYWNEHTGEWETFGRRKLKELEKDGEIIYDHRIRDYRNTSDEEKQKALNYRNETEELIRKLDQQHADRMTAMLEAYAEDLKMEWTQELLDAEFALGDGTRVTWGKATVEQHHKRMTMLSHNVESNLQAIKRHECAIADITASGTNSLEDI